MRRALFAAVVLVLLAPSCARPPDEAWLRFLGFGETISTGSLLNGESTVANAAFLNSSQGSGHTAGGTGVLVYRARIDYQMAGFSPPSSGYEFTLYLPPPGTGSTTAATLMSLQLAPASLKQWLIDTGAFRDAAAVPVVELVANVTFSGETDEGQALEAHGGILVALANNADAEAPAPVPETPAPKTCSTNCSASGACSSHGGVNCLAGPDVDGSVICVDETTDSSVMYHCD